LLVHSIMPVQPGEDVSSRHLVEFQCSISRDGTRHRPAAAARSLPPSRLITIPQEAESQTIRDGPWPAATKLSRVLSIPRLGTNTNKSRENIPAIPNQCDGIIRSRSKRLVRHPPRHLSSIALPRPPSMCTTDIALKRPTSKASFSPAISVGDETDEESDDPTAHCQKIRQLQIARLAKLTRHLGEEIPPELVFSSILPIDIAKSRSLAGSLNLSKDHQRRRSLDPTTADSKSTLALPSSRKSRSLRGTEGFLRLQTHGEHVVNVVDGKLPYALHPSRTEADFLKHSQSCIAASLCGPAGVAVDIRPSLAQVPSYSELEVDVQISKRTRFRWMKVGKNINVVQNVNPDDVTKQLREMKAST